MVVAGNAVQAHAGDPAAKFNLTNNLVGLALGPLANLSKVGYALTGASTDAALSMKTGPLGKTKC